MSHTSTQSSQRSPRGPRPHASLITLITAASIAVITGRVLVVAQTSPPPPPPAAASPPEAAPGITNPLESLEPGDGRLMTGQRPLQGATGLLSRLRPKRFLLHSGRLDNQGRTILDPNPFPAFGLVAQETLQAVPEAVYRPIDESREFWMLDYETFVPLLIRSGQEQQSEIQTQATRIEEQDRRIRSLESRVNELEGEMQKLKDITKVIDDATRSAFASLRSQVQKLATQVTSAEGKTSCTCSK